MIPNCELLFNFFFLQYHSTSLAFNKAGVPNDIWEEYYGQPAENYTNANNTKPTISSDFFLLLSNFKDFSDNVINCQISSIRLLHSICTYTNINRNSGSGGCISFIGRSSIVQDRFCSFKCYTPGSGKYSYTDVQTEGNKSFVNLGSLYQCGHDNTGYSSIYHFYGNKTLISTNNTKTRSKNNAGYHFRYNSVYVNFCCFVSNDNHENDYCCMYHLNAPDSFVKRSLFKNNTCKTGSFWGLLSSDGSSKVTVSECIFLENKADHTLASTYGGTLTAINCTGDLSVSSENGIVNTNEMTTSSFNLTLSLLSLGKCEAEFPFSFDFILFGSKKKKKLVIDDLLSFNFSLECLFNLTST